MINKRNELLIGDGFMQIMKARVCSIRRDYLLVTSSHISPIF